MAAAQRTVLLLQQGVAEAEDVAATACRHMNAALPGAPLPAGTIFQFEISPFFFERKLFYCCLFWREDDVSVSCPRRGVHSESDCSPRNSHPPGQLQIRNGLRDPSAPARNATGISSESGRGGGLRDSG